MSLFELLWERSVPLVPVHADTDMTEAGLPASDIQLLGLLFAGLTDAAIVRQLSTSVCTVQRRLTRLMERAGVGNRAQLAWHAARGGWLTPWCAFSLDPSRERAVARTSGRRPSLPPCVAARDCRDARSVTSARRPS
ncbi:helix-turn-helix transcriptional regulator [Streptomyces sp. NBC_00887]|uniref:helix-turn-helix domain-containing protein n=1 Tax=Streptomyces sp. NBC_00887 TaxID=2975859 RepID=UPI00386BBDFD|nr:helix-turn-helix transcriptional regulator [Streptomyces sp. NBC_00887]